MYQRNEMQVLRDSGCGILGLGSLSGTFQGGHHDAVESRTRFQIVTTLIEGNNFATVQLELHILCYNCALADDIVT